LKYREGNISRKHKTMLTFMTAEKEKVLGMVSNTRTGEGLGQLFAG